MNSHDYEECAPLLKKGEEVKSHINEKTSNSVAKFLKPVLLATFSLIVILFVSFPKTEKVCHMQLSFMALFIIIYFRLLKKFSKLLEVNI
jgi:positive regulator of sigma E activity